MSKHRAPISGIDAFSSKYVATAGYDNKLILWDGLSKEVVAEAQHDHLANQCRFSASGRLLVSASSDYSARVWSIPTLTPVAVLSGHHDDVEMAVFSPDESRVATASRDHKVRIFDLSGKLLACLEGHRSDVISVEWTSDGDEVISSGDDGSIRRFSTRSNSLVETIDLGGIEADTVVCGPDNLFFAGTDAGEIVTLRGGKVIKQVPGHASGVKRLIYNPATGVLLSAGYDRIVKLWSLMDDADLVATHVCDAPAVVWLRSAAFDGASSIVFGTFGSSFARYDIETSQWDITGVDDTPGVNATHLFRGVVHSVGDAGIVRREGTAIQELGSLCNFMVSFDQRLLTGGHLGQLYDAYTGEILYQHHSPLNCAASFQKDGVEHLAIGSYTGECIVIRKGKRQAIEVVDKLLTHENAIKGLACNAEHIFTVCATGAAAFTPISTLAREKCLANAHRKISNGASRLPDGRFVSVSRDKVLRIWDGDVAEEVDTPHSHSIKCVAVCPVSGLIATGSYNGLVAIYDAHESHWIKVEHPTRAGISSLSPAAQPKKFLAGSYDGNVYEVDSCADAVTA